MSKCSVLGLFCKEANEGNRLFAAYFSFMLLEKKTYIYMKYT